MSLLLVLTVVLSLLQNIFINPSYLIHASSSVDGVNITSVEMTMEKEGKIIVLDESIDTPISQDTRVALNYTWEIENWVDMTTGAIISLDIPLGFKCSNINFPFEIDGELGGHIYLNEITRQITVEFLPQEENYNLTGSFGFQTSFDFTGLPDENPVEFKFPLSGNAEKTIKLKFAPKGDAGLAIKKGGGANKAVNPDKITWTIDVNKQLETIKDVVVEDTLGEGLEFDKDSLKVYELLVKLNGDTLQGDQVNLLEGAIEDKSATGDFSIILGDISSAYRITYDTNIIDKTKTEFKNTATFSKGSSEAVVNITRGEILEKSGHPDRAFNPNSIAWTILANMSEDTLSDGRIEDTLPDGLEIDESSIQVYVLELNDNGTIKNEKAAVGVTQPSTNGNKLIVPLGATTKAHKIEYITKITDRTKTSFENAVELFDESTFIKDTNSLISFKRGTLLEKDSISHTVKHDEKHIDWVIDVNTAEEILQNVVLTDNIGTGLKLKPSSIKVYPLTFDSDGKATEEEELTDNGKITTDDQKIKIDFGAMSSAYRIKYTTDITNNNHVGKFSNEAILDGDGAGIGPDGFVVEKEVDIKIENTVSKSTNGSINYQEKTMPWKIVLRPTKEPMKEVTIEDTFPNDGLTMLPETVTITQADGTFLNSPEEYILKAREDLPSGEPDWTKGFKIDFISPIQDTDDVTVSYETSFDRLLHTNSTTPKDYKNKAEVEWKETSTGTKIIKSINASHHVSDKAVNNGSKSGTLRRTDREIDWVIDVNYLSERYVDLKIEDEILGQQQLKADSIKIYQYLVTSNGSTERGSEVSEDSYTFIEKENDKFAIQINGEITTPYRIEYTTKLVGQSQDKYENIAKADNKELKATVNFDNSEVFISKNGIRKGAKIEWKVNVNTSLSTISNATLKDELSLGHEYIEDTFKVYRMPEQDEVPPEEYELNIVTIDLITGQQYFELKFNDTITTEYVIEYETEITREQDGEVSNEVMLTGEGVSIKNDKAEDNIYVTVMTGGGTGTGTRGKIKLEKVDGNDPSQKLAGAMFEIINSKGDRSNIGPTDSNGNITIDRMKLGEYIIREKTAPTGYLLPQNNELKVTVDSIEEKVVPVKNYKPKILVIEKVDESNSNIKLQGTQFKLFKIEGIDEKPIQSEVLITDADGKVEVINLSYGEYILREEVAPEGYYKAPEQKIVIEEQDERVHVIVKDKKIPKGTLVINKVDAWTGAPIEGVGFRIYDQSGALVKEVYTDQKGEASAAGLVVGEYMVKETTVPVGYQEAYVEEKVTIRLDDSTTLNVKNDPLRTLVIKKTDKNRPNKLLGGAIFEINGTTLISPRRITTDEKGIAVLDKLNFGTYTIQEVKAPSNYQKLKEVVTVTIDAEKPIFYEINIENTQLSSGGGGGGGLPPVPEEPVKPEEPIETEQPEIPKGPEMPNRPTQPIIEEKTPVETPIEGDIDIPEESKPEIGEPPAHGTVTIDENGKWIYTPEPGFVGKDKFTIKINKDGIEEEILVEIDVEDIPLGSIEIPDVNGESKSLPKTGESSHLGIQLLGILLVVVGWIVKRRVVRL